MKENSCPTLSIPSFLVLLGGFMGLFLGVHYYLAVLLSPNNNKPNKSPMKTPPLLSPTFIRPAFIRYSDSPLNGREAEIRGAGLIKRGGGCNILLKPSFPHILLFNGEAEEE